MKVLSSIVLHSGAISGESEVVIEISAEEANELRKALAIVDKYKFAAYKKIKHNEANADWTMVDYSVKNDKVVVKISDGACG